MAARRCCRRRAEHRRQQRILQDISIQAGDPARNLDVMLASSTAGRKTSSCRSAAEPTARPNRSTTSRPATLANIDHIVVLMMENRSFDHMLGYLSLPVDQRGRGRQDVDGLKGGEFNLYNGLLSLLRADRRAFAPGPPHGYESVAHAINGGQMDGFVHSYAQATATRSRASSWGTTPPQRYPSYDALARDFADRPSMVRQPSRPDLSEPLLRADGPAQPRRTRILGVRQLEPDPARLHPDHLRLPVTTRKILRVRR